MGSKFLVLDALSFVWQYWDIFVEEFYYFECDSPNPVIFDVGSNIGMSIVYFKKIFPSSIITGFEPEPNACDFLKKNIASRNLPADSITIHECAAWIHDDGVLLDRSGSDSSGVAAGSTTNQRIEVKSLQLKKIIEDVDHIDFLKMDIEGAEQLVLKDCAESLSKVRKLFVEYHSFPGKSQDLDEVLKILKTAGFRIQVNSPFRYRKPFIRKSLHPAPEMDLQINIFAYRKE